MEPTPITFAQRQAIIDNFQLEIAERARKLRSQYNLQAQGLRARLEMRVNRIPQALRKRNIAELVEEYEAKPRPAPPPPMIMPVASERPQAALHPVICGRQAQAAKRKSDEISTLSSEGADKENEELPNPKKRTKPTTTATANSKATRTLPAARKAALPGTTNPTGILSPRSANSRTLPAPPAPFKSSNLSPEKKTIPRSGAVSRAGNTSRTGTRTVAKAAPVSENGRSSEASAGSNGTTIVKGGKVAAKKTTTTSTTMASKAAAARKAAVNTTAAAGRTLRKRN